MFITLPYMHQTLGVIYGRAIINKQKMPPCAYAIKLFFSFAKILFNVQVQESYSLPNGFKTLFAMIRQNGLVTRALSYS